MWLFYYSICANYLSKKPGFDFGFTSPHETEGIMSYQLSTPLCRIATNVLVSFDHNHGEKIDAIFYCSCCCQNCF